VRVLITGEAGFIGWHLFDAYLGRGDEVTVVDDLSTGSMANIRHLKGHPRFHHVIDSIHNRAVLAEMVDGATQSSTWRRPWACGWSSRARSGPSREVTILELARRVKALTGSASEEGFEDMPRRVPDVSKVGALVGFKPTKTLDEILEGVIAYQRGAAAGPEEWPAGRSPEERAPTQGRAPVQAVRQAAGSLD
jgi:nucleoside-diphosphate-sugar epimerase